MHTRATMASVAMLALLLCGAALAQNPQLQVDWQYTDALGTPVSGTVTIDDGATGTVTVEQAELGGTTMSWVLLGVDPTGNDLFPDVGYAVPPNPAGMRDGGMFNLGGPTSLVYTVTADPLNPGDPPRVSTCTLDIVVEDTTAPTITRVDCTSAPDPAQPVGDGGMAQFDDSVGGGRTVTFAATVTDTCDAAPVVSYAPASGSVFGAGDTTVTATATDASGNSSSISFTIRINSLVGPNAPVMVAEPVYTEGTTNEVAWTIPDLSTEFTEVVVSDDPTFAVILDTYRTDVTGSDPETHTFGGLVDATTYYYMGRAGLYGPTGGDIWGAWSGAVSSTQDAAAPVVMASDMVIEQEDLAGTVITGATWHQTTQADWLTDTLTDVDANASPGDVILSSAGGATIDTIGAGAQYSGALPGGFVANYFLATGNHLLTNIEHWLDTAANQTVGFAVYESPDLTGPFTTIYSDAVGITAVGPDFYSSGPIAVALQNGYYYAIGFEWASGEVRADPAAAGAFTIGSWQGDVSVSPGTLPGALGAPDLTPTPHYQRITSSAGSLPLGTVEGTLITPVPAVLSWGTLTYGSSTPGDSVLTIDVLDDTGAVIAADVGSNINLASVGVDAVTYPSISVRATLEAPSGLYSPILSSWTVGYDNGVPFGVYATDTVDPDFPVTANDGTGKLTGARSDGQPITNAFPLGATTITWTAQDHFGPNFGIQNPAGHTGILVQTVTVEDTTDPQIVLAPGAGITPSGSVWLVEQSSAAGTPLRYTYTANDACDSDPTVTVSISPGTILNMGDYSLIVTATDSTGNRAQRAVTVRVQDSLPPTGFVQSFRLYKPNPVGPYSWADIQRGLNYWYGINDFPAPAPASFTDICDPVVDVLGYTGPGAFVLGTNTIYWEVVDDAGNSGFIPQQILIDDLTPPPGGAGH